ATVAYGSQSARPRLSRNAHGRVRTHATTRLPNGDSERACRLREGEEIAAGDVSGNSFRKRKITERNKRMRKVVITALSAAVTCACSGSDRTPTAATTYTAPLHVQAAQPDGIAK